MLAVSKLPLALELADAFFADNKKLQPWPVGQVLLGF